MTRLAVQIVNGLMLLLFATAAVVQYDDPDPALWVGLYGVAALACALFMANRLPAWLAGVLTGAYVLGGLYLLLPILGPEAFYDTTGQEMMGLMEESREMMGLLIMAAWTGFLTWRLYRRDPAATPSASEQPNVTNA
ncbi:MAG: hypothetical protein GVY35_12910 [Bacteroidetes bacterium]|jgi:ABC-type transporter lipoprotein component MlaA|nr:hypothetical protein [Bacteroidota bacterium]